MRRFPILGTLTQRGEMLSCTKRPESLAGIQGIYYFICWTKQKMISFLILRPRGHWSLKTKRSKCSNAIIKCVAHLQDLMKVDLKGWLKIDLSKSTISFKRPKDICQTMKLKNIFDISRTSRLNRMYWALSEMSHNTCKAIGVKRKKQRHATVNERYWNAKHAHGTSDEII